MRTRTVVVLGVVAAGIAVLAAPRLMPSRRAAPAVEPAAMQIDEAPLRVEIVRVAPRAIAERLATSGTVRANEQVDLLSEIAGVVKRIEFDEGTTVRRGQRLVKIEDDELQAQRERVVHRLSLAESREARQRELREQGVASEQDYDVASNELAVLRAELRLVDAQIEKTEIRAPFAGVVGLRYISEGSLLSPQTRIATLQDLASVKIDFTVPEQYAGRIRPGDDITFRIKGSDQDRQARVYATEPRINAETRSLTIRARSDNPGRALLPGSFADVALSVGEVPDALVVPSLAVVPELGGQKVFVVENGLAQPRPVQTGIRSETDVQIVSGLNPGDEVIVSAIQRLRAGLPVEPVPAGDAGGGAAAAQ